MTVFMPLTIPGGRTVSVEIDMGSDELILDERFVDGVQGTDETGHEYTRTFTRISGRIHPGGGPELAQDDRT